MKYEQVTVHKTTMETSGENEVRFAKRLAANEPKIRNKAIKQLSKFIVAKSTRGGKL